MEDDHFVASQAHQSVNKSLGGCSPRGLVNGVQSQSSQYEVQRRGSGAALSVPTLQVDFPERPGALRAFLSVVVPRWNLTLFHYRKSGNRSTSILVGIQVPPDTVADFEAAQHQLGDEFIFSELPDNARQMFDMFIS